MKSVDCRIKNTQWLYSNFTKQNYVINDIIGWLLEHQLSLLYECLWRLHLNEYVCRRHFYHYWCKTHKTSGVKNLRVKQYHKKQTFALVKVKCIRRCTIGRSLMIILVLIHFPRRYTCMSEKTMFTFSFLVTFRTQICSLSYSMFSLN